MNINMNYELNQLSALIEGEFGLEKEFVEQPLQKNVHILFPMWKHSPGTLPATRSHGRKSLYLSLIKPDNLLVLSTSTAKRLMLSTKPMPLISNKWLAYLACIFINKKIKGT